MGYKPNRDGVRELARSAGVQGAAMAGAAVVLGRAQADDPDGGYVSSPAVVPAGWQNEARAGARVTETRRGEGARRRTLARAVEGSS